jgi:hypothetical protein
MTRIVLSAQSCRPNRRPARGVRRLAASSLVVLLLAAAGAGAAENDLPTSTPAPRYEFVNIADSTGPLDNFIHSFPAINNSGTVVFDATYEGGPRGLFTGSGGPLRTVIDGRSGGPITATTGAPLAINDAGTVAFVGDAGSLAAGVYTASPDGTIRTIATGFLPGIFLGNPPPPQPYPVIDDSLCIDAAGNATFLYYPTAGVHTIVTGDGGPLRTVVDTRGPLKYLGRPSVNRTGDIAFVATPDSGPTGVYVVEQGIMRRVAGDWDQDGLSPVDSYASINDRGDIMVSGGEMAMNNYGVVAFQGFDPVMGIFTGPDPVADKVIARGDPLFGSEVRILTLFLGGLNDRGDVVFKYDLADNRRGIAVARAVPEPGAVALAALLAPTLLRYRAAASRPAWLTRGRN